MGDIYIHHDVSLLPSLIHINIYMCTLVLQYLANPRNHVSLPSTHWKKEDLPVRETMDVGCHIPRPRSWPTIWLASTLLLFEQEIECVCLLQLYEYLIKTRFPYHHQGPNPSGSSRQ